LLFAGTELGVFVSFDAGDHWESLQLNLPPVSVRDVAIKGDDLVVGTHGRGFWVIDGINALRQITPDLAARDAFLFAPGPALLIPPPEENGTPQPRDEPLALNRPHGALIDYYLGRPASGPVTLEVLDASGQLVRRWSSEDRPAAVDPDTLNVPAFWRRPPEPLASAAGMHRWVWDLRGTPPPPPSGTGRPGAPGGYGRRPQAPLVTPGAFTVKLTANGKSYAQPLNVEADPRR
jgi:hypothetical protein